MKSEGVHNDLMNSNKDYDNMSSQNILKPRLLNLNVENNNNKANKEASNCFCVTELNIAVRIFN